MGEVLKKRPISQSPIAAKKMVGLGARNAAAASGAPMSEPTAQMSMLVRARPRRRRVDLRPSRA